MDTTLLYDKQFNDDLVIEWKKWTTAQGHYPNKVMWWCRHVKNRLRYFSTIEGGKKREYHKKTENHYYEVVHNILRGPRNFEDKAKELKMTKR
jgi:hypothetical protein